MKKFSATILFSILLALSFIHAGAKTNPIKLLAKARSATQQLSSHQHFPGSDIEHGHIQGFSNGQAGNGFQLVPPGLATAFRYDRPSPLTVHRASYAVAELFRNTYLFHNYPSHNFW